MLTSNRVPSTDLRYSRSMLLYTAQIVFANCVQSHPTYIAVCLDVQCMYA